MEALSPSTAKRSWLRRWLNRMEVDRAVFYAIATRAWQFIAGPISILMIVAFFTKELQGTSSLTCSCDNTFFHEICSK